MKFRLAVLLAVVTLALGACAGATRWEHPQTGVASLEEDLTQCSREARNRSASYSLASGGLAQTGPGRIYRESGVPLADETFGAAAAPRRDPQQDEAWLTHDCMQAKGYRQVPVPKESAKS
jgi:hypothetical protein